MTEELLAGWPRWRQVAPGLVPARVRAICTYLECAALATQPSWGRRASGAPRKSRPRVAPPLGRPPVGLISGRPGCGPASAAGPAKRRLHEIRHRPFVVGAGPATAHLLALAAGRSRARARKSPRPAPARPARTRTRDRHIGASASEPAPHRAGARARPKWIRPGGRGGRRAPGARGPAGRLSLSRWGPGKALAHWLKCSHAARRAPSAGLWGGGARAGPRPRRGARRGSAGKWRARRPGRAQLGGRSNLRTMTTAP